VKVYGADIDTLAEAVRLITNHQGRCVTMTHEHAEALAKYIGSTGERIDNLIAQLKEKDRK